jgi:hypothetical protein
MNGVPVFSSNFKGEWNLAHVFRAPCNALLISAIHPPPPRGILLLHRKARFSTVMDGHSRPQYNAPLF